MKVNFKKLQTKNLFICTDGNLPKKDSEVVEMLDRCVKHLLSAQAGRKENTLGESWAADAILELIDCIETKN